jgi:hypothetical protein
MPSSSEDTNPFGMPEEIVRQETESVASYLRHHPKVLVGAFLSLLALLANVVTVWLTK